MKDTPETQSALFALEDLKHAGVAWGKFGMTEATGKRFAAMAEVVQPIFEGFLRSDFDLSPCRLCGLPVVCIPDGLPFCGKCAGESR